MVRAFLAALLGLTLCFGAAIADDTKTDKDKKSKEATITKVDAKAKTLKVKIKDKEGKDAEKEFKLTETVRYLDSTGKEIAIDVFKSGDEVLVLEAEGVLKEVKKCDKKSDKTPAKP
jgi:3-dehydroquinate synthase class II